MSNAPSASISRAPLLLQRHAFLGGLEYELHVALQVAAHAGDDVGGGAPQTRRMHGRFAPAFTAFVDALKYRG